MASKASLEVSSLLVPSVVEMAKESSASIPSRYLRSDIEKAVVPDGDQVLEIPVIDMQKLVSGGPNNSEVKKLDFACKEWGFFQVSCHNPCPIVLNCDCRVRCGRDVTVTDIAVACGVIFIFLWLVCH